MNKNTTQKLLTIIISFFMVFGYNKHTYTYHETIKKKIIILNRKNNNNYKCYLNFNKSLIQKNKKNYIILSPNNTFLEIQINDNSFNLLNTNISNENLIFNQLSLQLLNEKKIYDFGIGYRKHYGNQWIIGNNIFYDTTITPYGKKYLSIGNEIFKNNIYLSSNTYYNISCNDPRHIKNKKHIPYAYDLYAICPLPFYKNIYGKINIENIFSNNNHQQYKSQNTKNQFYPLSKLLIGISYVPASILILSLDKTIFNSIKTYETKFNILVNYKIYVPWIYQKKYNINKNDYCSTEILSIHNHYPSVARNKKIFCHHNQITSQEIKTHNILKDYSEKIKLLENIVLEKNNLLHDSHQIQNQQLKQQKTLTIFEPKKTSYIDDETLPSITNSQFTFNNELSYPNLENFTSERNNHNILHKKNHEIDLEKKDDWNNTKISKYIIEQNSDLQLKTTSDTETQKSYHNNSYHYSKIPSPPPIPNSFLNTPHHNITLKNDDIRSETNIDVKQDQNNIKKINEHKQEKFSLIGSEEHLLKLNDIIKKRKKTTSISSNDSNDSETKTLFKIIERQTILTRNNDTDSDDQHSTISNNEFSEDENT